MIRPISAQIPRILLVLAFFCAPFSLAWSAGGADGYYEDARQRYYAGDREAALIQLKNALQADSQHIPSLLLAGEIQMELARPADAGHQFSEALLLGADRNLLAPKLAEAYLVQGKYTELVKQIPADDLSGSAKIEVLAYRAQAFLGLGNLEAAAQTVSRANTVEPGALSPNVANVSLLISQADYDKALAVAEKLVVDWPEAASSWSALGVAQQANGEPGAAIQSYSRALELDQAFDQARMGRVALLVDAKRDEEAWVDLDFLGKIHPLDPRLRYLRAQLSERAGEHEEALKQYKFAVEVLATLPPETITNDPQLTLIAGLSHYGYGNYENARSFLDIYLSQNSEDVAVSMLLASILLQLDDAPRATKILTPLYKGDSNNPRILALLAAAHSQTGHYERAIQLLMRITDIQPDSETFTDLARYRLSAGYTAEGLLALQQIVADDAANISAGFSLAAAYLDMGRTGEAVKITASLVGHAPDNLAVQNLHAMALLANGDANGAEQALKNLVRAEPGFVPANISLARVEVQLGKYEAADQRLQALLEKQKTNATVMLELARMERSRGRLREAQLWAEAAVREESPAMLEAKIFLIDHMLATGDIAEAEDIASNMANGADESLRAQAIYAQVMTAAEKPDIAATIYRRMQKLAGFNVDKLYRIAKLQAELGAWDAAAVTLRKALTEQPEHEPSLLLYAQSYVESKDFERALGVLDGLLTAHPESTVGRGAQAETLARSGALDQALVEYQKVLSKNYDQRWLVGLFRVHVLSGEHEQAEALLRDTLEAYPNDTLVRMTLSDYLLGLQRWQGARHELEVLLAEFPDNPVLLNNMAFTLNELDSPEALTYARRAYDLAPQDGSINDTLGWLLVSSGQAEEGLPLLREASTRMANDPQVRYHLGVALHQLGRKAEAKAELQQALELGRAGFSQRADVKHLLETL